MGNEAITAASITAAGQLASTGLSAMAAANMNRRTQKYNAKRYDIERADALKDWNMQNEYNSPSAQMARFRDAGLNPHLIYGQQNEGATVRSTDSKPWNPRTPQVDLQAGPTLAAYYDTQLKEASLANMTAQNQVLRQEALLKAIQASNTSTATENLNFDLTQKRSLAQTSVQAAEANLRKLTIENNLALNRDNREQMSLTQNLAESASRIILNNQNVKESISRIKNANLATQSETMQREANTQLIRRQIAQSFYSQNLTSEQIKNLQSTRALQGLDQQLKQTDLNMKKVGLQPSDELWQRMIAQWVDKYKNHSNADGTPKK